MLPFFSWIAPARGREQQMQIGFPYCVRRVPAALRFPSRSESFRDDARVFFDFIKNGESYL